MKAKLNAADKFTQYAFAAVLTLFAVACMLSGCRFETGQAAPTEATIRENRTVESTAAREETLPKYLDMGEFKLTAYCACRSCCGIWADGITATGTKPVQGRTIAVDEDVIPFGSEVIINGYTYTAEDCGSGIIGREIDIYFESHEEAEAFGVQYGKVILKVGGSDVYN